MHSWRLHKGSSCVQLLQLLCSWQWQGWSGASQCSWPVAITQLVAMHHVHMLPVLQNAAAL